jgi:hypothetical protein
MRYFKVIQEESLFILNMQNKINKEELDGPAVSVLGVRSRKLSNVRKGQSLEG